MYSLRAISAVFLLSLLAGLTADSDVSEASPAAKLSTCVNPRRLDQFQYFSEKLPGCGEHITPYCTVHEGSAQCDWYLLLDGAGWYVESATFSIGDSNATYSRSCTPSIACYNSDDLSLFEVAWISIDSGLFEWLPNAAAVSLVLNRVSDSPKKIKFADKACSALLAFRDSVQNRLQSGVNPLSLTPLRCDSSYFTDMDTLKSPHARTSPFENWFFDTECCGNADTTLPLYDLGAFTVRGPRNAVVVNDTVNGVTLLSNKKHPEEVWLQVLPVPISLEQCNWPEERIADQVIADMETLLLQDGVWKRNYELREIWKGTRCVGCSRAFYFAGRLITEERLGGYLRVYHLWFPPDFRSTRTAYFLMNGEIYTYMKLLCSLRPTADERP